MANPRRNLKRETAGPASHRRTVDACWGWRFAGDASLDFRPSNFAIFRGFVFVRLLAGLAVCVVVGLLLLAVVDIERREAIGLKSHVAEQMPRSGVENEVTAVLLNFRSYDTLLEIGVLLLAAMAVLALRRERDVGDVPHDPPPGPVLGWVVRMGVPVMVLGGGYLLWAGSRWPGGAFQAGAVLGAAGVVLRLGGWEAAGALRGVWLRVALAVGFGAFALLGVAVMPAGAALLEYPPGWQTLLILAVEVFASVSIGVTLALLFVAGEVGQTGNGQRAGRVIEE